MGSSARRTFGSFTSARAIATPAAAHLRTPKEVGAPVRESHLVEGRAARRRRSTPIRAGDEGDLDVLEGRQRGDQVERLEDEAEGPRPQICQLRLAHAAEVAAVEGDDP